MSKITVYGADWCGDTRRTRRQLDSLGIAYKYVDVDADPAASDWITEQNNGKRLTPTVQINDQLLFEPTNAEMAMALLAAGMVA